MKRYLLLVIVGISIFNPSMKAGEGMWLLPMIQKLNIEDMHDLGFKLSAEDIYSINQASIKDAIVIFDRGCTGQIISDEGLILTNHHCGYGAIQQHSSVEHDYLRDGFWAMTKDAEIATPGLSVTFLKRVEEVSERVNAALCDVGSEKERVALVDSMITLIKDEATEGNDYSASVKPFYSGNNYYLFVYEKYTDVRMVGAPPSSIGKFGADTDNWMWPRHTADFSLFRVYTSPEGAPADFAEENIPMKPKYHLPISLKGVQTNDFAMILGYPGSTDRYLTSWGIEERMHIVNMARIVIRDAKQKVWLEDMQADQKVRIQYSSKYSRSTNYYKNSIGMNRGLENLNVLEKKRALEASFEKWIAEDTERSEKYGEALSLLKNGYTNRASQLKATSYFNEAFMGGAEIFRFAMKTRSLSEALKSKNKEDIEKEVEALRESGQAYYKNYNPATDEKTVATMLDVFAKEIGSEYRSSLYDVIAKKYKNNYRKYAQVLFKKSIFANEARFYAFLEKPSYSKLKKDMAIVDGANLFKENSNISRLAHEEDFNIAKGKRLFEAGIKEMQSDKVFYPDANFSMRMTYGTVGDYIARDAVHYLQYTTLKGVMEKEDPDNWEFVVAPKLKSLYEQKDYGRYGDSDGSMHVCFLTDNDITGGNSGSGVMNSNGELFGLAFDGNWEAMSGDIAFEPELQKTINVDIRYVLFIIDKFAGAKNLIEEMTIVE